MSTTVPSPNRISTETLIETVRQKRNEYIKQLLKNDNLQLVFKDVMGRELSKVRAEFLKRDLSELLIAPVDLVFYSSLIKKLHENAGEWKTSDGETMLVSQQITLLFSKYSY